MKSIPKTYYVILGFLGMQPLTGYAIKSAIARYLQSSWGESWGQIYPALRDLEARGWIARRDEGEGRRKVFTITRAGRTVLHDYLAVPPAAEVVRNELPLKILFGGQASEEAIRGHLERERGRRELRLAGHVPEPPGDGLARADRWQEYALLFGRMYDEFVSRWCQTVLEDLRGERYTVRRAAPTTSVPPEVHAPQRLSHEDWTPESD